LVVNAEEEEEKSNGFLWLYHGSARDLLMTSTPSLTKPTTANWIKEHLIMTGKFYRIDWKLRWLTAILENIKLYTQIFMTKLKISTLRFRKQSSSQSLSDKVVHSQCSQCCQWIGNSTRTIVLAWLMGEMSKACFQ
jgi:hypothetical protein